MVPSHAVVGDNTVTHFQVGQLHERSAENRNRTLVKGHYTPAVHVGGFDALHGQVSTQSGHTVLEGQHAHFTAHGVLGSSSNRARRKHGTFLRIGHGSFFTIPEGRSARFCTDLTLVVDRTVRFSREQVTGDCQRGVRTIINETVGSCLRIHFAVISSNGVTAGGHGEYPVSLGIQFNIGCVLVDHRIAQKRTGQSDSLRRCISSQDGTTNYNFVSSRQIRHVVHLGGELTSSHQRVSRCQLGSLFQLGREHVVHSSASRNGGHHTGKRGVLLQVHDVPLTSQATGGRHQVCISVLRTAIHSQEVRVSTGARNSTIPPRSGGRNTGGNGGNAAQIGSSPQHIGVALCFAAYMLDRIEQTILAVRAFQAFTVVRRNVSHRQDFDITFQGLLGFVGIGPHAARQTVGDEVLTAVSDRRNCGNGASFVSSNQVGQASLRVFADDTGPDVARGQEDLEVQHVVRVRGATEAHFHSLTVDGVGIGQVKHRQVTLLGRVVRHQQNVSSTALCHFQRSRGRTGETQAANQGGNAQGQNVLFHKNFSSKKTR